MSYQFKYETSKVGGDRDYFALMLRLRSPLNVREHDSVISAVETIEEILSAKVQAVMPVVLMDEERGLEVVGPVGELDVPVLLTRKKPNK